MDEDLIERGAVPATGGNAGGEAALRPGSIVPAVEITEHGRRRGPARMDTCARLSTTAWRGARVSAAHRESPVLARIALSAGAPHRPDSTRPDAENGAAFDLAFAMMIRVPPAGVRP